MLVSVGALASLAIACTCAEGNRPIAVAGSPWADGPLWIRVDKNYGLPARTPVLQEGETGLEIETRYGLKIEQAEGRAMNDFEATQNLLELRPSRPLMPGAIYRVLFSDENMVVQDVFEPLEASGLTAEEPLDPPQVHTFRTLGMLDLDDCAMSCGTQPHYEIGFDPVPGAALYVVESPSGAVLGTTTGEPLQVRFQRLEEECLRFRMVAIGIQGQRSSSGLVFDSCIDAEFGVPPKGCGCTAYENRRSSAWSLMLLALVLFGRRYRSSAQHRNPVE